jgi:hypothetical protein
MSIKQRAVLGVLLQFEQSVQIIVDLKTFHLTYKHMNQIGRASCRERV